MRIIYETYLTVAQDDVDRMNEAIASLPASLVPRAGERVRVPFIDVKRDGHFDLEVAKVTHCPCDNIVVVRLTIPSDHRPWTAESWSEWFRQRRGEQPNHSAIPNGSTAEAPHG
jgi:hypothetical protein